MGEENRAGFFDGFAYFREASVSLSQNDSRSALHAIIRGVNDDIASGKDVDGSRLLLCLQANCCLADVSLAEVVPGWHEYDRPGSA